ICGWFSSESSDSRSRSSRLARLYVANLRAKPIVSASRLKPRRSWWTSAAGHGGIDEAGFERLMRFPQLAVVDLLDRIPHRRVAAALHPVGAEVPVVDEAHLRRKPGVYVHAVGDVADRDVLLTHTWEQRHPHRARNLPMQR